MSSGAVFEHISARGWLCLAGGSPSLGGPFPDLADFLLAKLDLARTPMALLPPERRAGTESTFMQEIEDLLGVPKVSLPVGEILQDELREAGVLVLEGGTPPGWLRHLGPGGVEEAVLAFLQDDGVLIACGPAAAVMGAWYLADGGGQLEPALGWLAEGMVLPGVSEPGLLESVRTWLGSQDRSYALGLPEGTALAIGPQGALEVWSREAPKVILGRGWVA